MKKVKKVLQNGYKYPQNSSTLYSIDFIHLNALKFPKIVKNYYGAPPPPAGGGGGIALSIGRSRNGFKNLDIFTDDPVKTADARKRFCKQAAATWPNVKISRRAEQSF